MIRILRNVFLYRGNANAGKGVGVEGERKTERYREEKKDESGKGEERKERRGKSERRKEREWNIDSN